MTKRILPADAYDTLEFSALAYGGIGAGHYFDPKHEDMPLCAIGHFHAAERSWGMAECAFRNLGLSGNDSDLAVEAINRRRKVRPLRRRVPFRLWARELGIERGQ